MAETPASPAKDLPWCSKDVLRSFVTNSTTVKSQYPHHVAVGGRAPCGGAFVKIKLQYLTDNHALGFWLGICDKLDEPTHGPPHYLSESGLHDDPLALQEYRNLVHALAESTPRSSVRKARAHRGRSTLLSPPRTPSGTRLTSSPSMRKTRLYPGVSMLKDVAKRTGDSSSRGKCSVLGDIDEQPLARVLFAATSSKNDLTPVPNRKRKHDDEQPRASGSGGYSQPARKRVRVAAAIIDLSGPEQLVKDSAEHPQCKETRELDADGTWRTVIEIL